MKTIYIDQLHDGESLQGQTFAVFAVKRATDKYNKQYLELLIGDKTGKIKAMVWTDVLARINTKLTKVGKVVAVDAKVEDYKGKLQLKVTNLTQVDETKVDEYIQSSQLDENQMLEELKNIVSDFDNSDLVAMFESMFADDEFLSKLKYWPAATSYHHEFRSGLLQHILEGVAFANGLERFYPSLDFEVVYTGIILHDLGKLEELDASGFATRYTVVGSVLGHIYLGTQVIDKYFPSDGNPDLKMHLKHIVLSHHGDKEKGSPVLPATPEAILVHSADSSSAITRMATDAIDGEVDEYGMTPFIPHMQRWMWAAADVGSTDEDEIVYDSE